MTNTRVLSPAAIAAVFNLLQLALQVNRASALTDIIHPPVNVSDNRTPLYFALIQSFSGIYVSAHSIVGLEVALDLINENKTLLPGYSLHYVLTDAPVSAKKQHAKYQLEVARFAFACEWSFARVSREYPPSSGHKTIKQLI